MKGAQNNIFGKMKKSIRRLNIYILVLLPIIVAFAILAIMLSIGTRLYGGEIPQIYIATSGVVFLIVASFSGFVQIIRREGPGIFGQPVFGVWPVITGSIIVVICLVVLIILLIDIYQLTTG